MRRTRKDNEYIKGIKNVDFTQVTEYDVLHPDLNSIGTINLMTKLSHNDFYKPLEKGYDALLLYRYEGGESLYIVSKNNLRFELKYPDGICGETRMTDLKKKYVFYDVLNCLKNFDSNFTALTSAEKLLHISSKPYLLNAMTDYDRDYGNIYHGEDLVKEGNQYGDTSEFYIIGYTESVD